jgi:diaminohydroxyphosphoribosylaminopyrimidine deaminase/5-amino-6-(5-phosphoribosylamino)uracil reductase
MDAIVTGIGTVLADDPQLTARPPGPRTAARVVLDSHGRLPPASRMAVTAREVPVVVATANASAEALARLRECGCEILDLAGPERRVDVGGLLAEMGRRRWTNVLVEGGSGVLGSFLDGGAVDEVHVFVAPRLFGGARALTPVAGTGVAHVADAPRLAECRFEHIGEDVYIHGRIAREPLP